MGLSSQLGLQNRMIAFKDVIYHVFIAEIAHYYAVRCNIACSG